RQELAGTLKELKRQLAALGSVNLEAIDEYRQVRERHEFLSAQREDLLEAHTALQNVIKDMDEIMAKRFRDTFEQVNQNFGQTFVQLFGGGSAAMFLTEPDDPLMTGVDLLVQPPGKKLINYNLLSGGEKSLVGVALVLAIFQVKPSPFCILDEVDAALDETNVERFAEYIKMFKQKTQFIVVTHRQGTMEAADRLWGITMEKDGVSKIVSVRLTDDLQQYVS
ncbi:MAG: AAA family ATPase, partial [Firmicutes bacterium]|nr:AAA family ATPase [Bacillota bacterium]